MTAATSRASRSRSSSAVGFSSSGVAPRSTTGGPTGAASRTGSSATYSGCDSGSATMSSRNTALTKSMTGRAVRKLRVRRRGAAPNAERARRKAAMSARRNR